MEWVRVPDAWQLCPLPLCLFWGHHCGQLMWTARGWCASDLRGPKSPRDTRSVSGVIYILGRVEIKNKTLANRADGKPLWRLWNADGSKSTGPYPKWMERSLALPAPPSTVSIFTSPHTGSRQGSHTPKTGSTVTQHFPFKNSIWCVSLRKSYRFTVENLGKSIKEKIKEV